MLAHAIAEYGKYLHQKNKQMKFNYTRMSPVRGG